MQGRGLYMQVAVRDNAHTSIMLFYPNLRQYHMTHGYPMDETSRMLAQGMWVFGAGPGPGTGQAANAQALQHVACSQVGAAGQSGIGSIGLSIKRS